MQMVYNIWSVYNIEERMRIMTKKKSTKFLIPLILLLTVVPQIVYIYEYDSNLTQFDWCASYDIKWDFFMYYKFCRLN